MSVEDEIRIAMEEAMAEPQYRFTEKSPGVFVCDDLPNVSLFRLRYGGWRFQIGGYESPTYGQRHAAERDLIVEAQTRSSMGKQQ